VHAAPLPVELTGIKIEVPEKPEPPVWTTVGWVAEVVEVAGKEATHIYIFYAGDLHNEENVAIPYEIDLMFTAQDGYRIKQVADETFTPPVETYTKENLPVSAATTPSVSFTIVDGDEHESSGVVHFLPIAIEPDADMSGVVGDVVESVQENSIIKHFITPKKSTELDQDYVELKAVGVHADIFTKFLKWEGGEAGSAEDKRKVKRDTTRKTEVKIKMQQCGTVASQMNVWVVWAELTARTEGAEMHDNNEIRMADNEFRKLGSDSYTNVTITEGLEGIVTWTTYYFLNGIEWRADINPKEIFDTENNVPKLNDLNERLGYNPDAPNGFRAAYSDWDMTRDMKRTFTIDENIIIDHSDWVTDDNGDNDEDGNPYDGAADEPSGEIFSVDGPGLSPNKRSLDGVIQHETAGESMENKNAFQEWVRIKLGQNWFRISKKEDWHSKVSIVKENGSWIISGNNGMAVGVGTE